MTKETRHQSSTVHVKKPVTSRSLIESKHVTTEAELQGAKLMYKAASMELHHVLQEAPKEEVMVLFAEGGEAPSAPEEIKIQPAPGRQDEASRKVILMQHGWPYVLELIQHLLRENSGRRTGSWESWPGGLA